MVVSKCRTAIYCRLSRDDGNEESQSISTQREILTNYVLKQGWTIVNVYVDDGYSGTNFDRPGFQNLIRDIELGIIDIVITKDLSRLGRNYIQTGYYTEEYFPDKNVRYIALNDNYDTDKEDSNDFAPFKNIINEWYAKDISKKVRFTLDNMAKNGEARNTVFPIFGYMYNENYERIPDPELAPIVQYIFKEYLKTNSSVKVAKILKEKKIKIPSYYNAIKYNYNKQKILAMSEEKLIDWKPYQVRDILANDSYIGTYRTAQTRTRNFKSKKRIKNNENVYIFENRYEPIVDKNMFEAANRILKRTRSAILPLEENLLRGLVVCPHCLKPMIYERKKDHKDSYNYYRYFCRNPRCSEKNTIQKEYLYQIIAAVLLNLKKIILSNPKAFKDFATDYYKRQNKIDDSKSKKELELGKYETKLEEIDRFIVNLFEQNEKGYLPSSTYEMMIKKYNKERKYIEDQIHGLRNNFIMPTMKYNINDEIDAMINLLKEIDENDVLNSEIIHTLIKNIEVKAIPVSKNKRKKSYEINITWFSQDEIVKEYIKTYEGKSSNLCQTV